MGRPAVTGRTGTWKYVPGDVAGNKEKIRQLLIQFDGQDHLVRKQMGIASSTYFRLKREMGGTKALKLAKDYLSKDARPPVLLRMSENPEVRACGEDTPEGFRRFNDRYWPDELMPDHVFEWVQDVFVYSCCDSHMENPCSRPKGRWNPSVVLNVPPDHAKSTYFSKRWAIWRVAQDRDWQILIISATDELASQFIGYIASNLMENELLLEDCGDFYAQDKSCLFQQGSGKVRVYGSTIRGGYNIMSRGKAQQMQGLRAREVVVDDVIEPSDVLTEDRRGKDSHLYHNVILSRVRGGITRVIGTRQHMFDLYDELSKETGRTGQPVYVTISIPALRDPESGAPSTAENAVALWECRGEHTLMGSSGWPDCCRPREFLLSDACYGRVGASAFELTYQQNPLPPEARTIQPEWIYGSDWDDNPDRGSLDRSRNWGDQKRADDRIRALCFDPGHGKKRYAGDGAILVQDILLDKTQFSTEILGFVRKKMDFTSAILELDTYLATYRPNFCVVEDNAAQHTYLETGEFKELMRKYGVKPIPHTTSGKTKWDPETGVQSLGWDFRLGKIRIPYGDPEARTHAQKLIDELLMHPVGGKDDLMMALWFGKSALRNLYRPRREFSGIRGVWAGKPGAKWTFS